MVLMSTTGGRDCSITMTMLAAALPASLVTPHLRIRMHRAVWWALLARAAKQRDARCRQQRNNQCDDDRTRLSAAMPFHEHHCVRAAAICVNL